MFNCLQFNRSVFNGSTPSNTSLVVVSTSHPQIVATASLTIPTFTGNSSVSLPVKIQGSARYSDLPTFIGTSAVTTNKMILSSTNMSISKFNGSMYLMGYINHPTVTSKGVFNGNLIGKIYPIDFEIASTVAITVSISNDSNDMNFYLTRGRRCAQKPTF